MPPVVMWSDISAIGLFDVCLGAVEISSWLAPPAGGLDSAPASLTV